jgi:hypothetical protein
MVSIGMGDRGKEVVYDMSLIDICTARTAVSPLCCG